MYRLTKHRADCPEKQHHLEVARQEKRLDALQDQVVKMQDRFDLYIMLQLKQGSLRLEEIGNKKQIEEPNFVSEKMIGQIELFDELDTFKKIAS